MAKKTRTYRWIVHEDGDVGKWHLTQEQVNFLTYLQNNDFLRDDLEFYRLHNEEAEYDESERPDWKIV